MNKYTILLLLTLLMACEQKPSFYVIRAQALAEKGDYQKMFEVTDELLEKEPKYPRGLYLRGIANYELGKYQEALEDFNQALTSGVIQTEVSINIDRAINNGPSFPPLYPTTIKFERGQALLQMDSLNAAFQDFEECRKAQYKIGACYYYTGLAYLRAGKNEEGCADFKKAIEWEIPEAKEYLNRYCN